MEADKHPRNGLVLHVHNKYHLERYALQSSVVRANIWYIPVCYDQNRAISTPRENFDEKSEATPSIPLLFPLISHPVTNSLRPEDQLSTLRSPNSLTLAHTPGLFIHLYKFNLNLHLKPNLKPNLNLNLNFLTYVQTFQTHISNSVFLTPNNQTKPPSQKPCISPPSSR